MWKLSDDDYNRTWSYSEEKPQLNTDPNDDVKKKKEKPNMVGVLEMVRHTALLHFVFVQLEFAFAFEVAFELHKCDEC